MTKLGKPPKRIRYTKKMKRMMRNAKQKFLWLRSPLNGDKGDAKSDDFE